MKISYFKIFLTETFFVFLTYFLGIFCAQNIQKMVSFYNISFEKISFFEFLLIFFVATIVFLLITYLKKGKRIKSFIWQFFFFFALFSGLFLFFESFLVPIFAFFISLLLAILYFRKPFLFFHNLIMSLAIGGLAGFLGLALQTKTVFFLLIFLSFYDIFAVFVSKHMIRMAKEMIEQKVIMGFVFPLKFSAFKEKISEVLPQKEKFMVLGGGDVCLPLLFFVSLVPFCFFKSIIVALFSLIGLFFNFLIFLKRGKKPIPALPLIALFSIVGYLIILLI